MKKILTTLAAFSAILMAGGNTAPVETYSGPVVQKPSAYVGIGYGFGTAERSFTDGTDYIGGSADVDNISLQGGYNFNEFVAVEGRYNFGLDNEDVYNGGVDTFAMYVKPQYPLTDELTVYVLGGYAWNTIYADTFPDVDVDGLAYGVGAKYAVQDNVEVFVDYTSVYSDDVTYTNGVTEDADIYNVTLGLTYKF